MAEITGKISSNIEIDSNIQNSNPINGVINNNSNLSSSYSSSQEDIQLKVTNTDTIDSSVTSEIPNINSQMQVGTSSVLSDILYIRYADELALGQVYPETMYLIPTENTKYLGIARSFNNISDNPQNYTWIRIKGIPGQQGNKGDKGDTGTIDFVKFTFDLKIENLSDYEQWEEGTINLNESLINSSTNIMNYYIYSTIVTPQSEQDERFVYSEGDYNTLKSKMVEVIEGEERISSKDCFPIVELNLTKFSNENYSIVNNNNMVNDWSYLKNTYFTINEEMENEVTTFTIKLYFEFYDKKPQSNLNVQVVVL